MIDLFDWGARNFPERLAFAGAGGDITYGKAQAATNRIARTLVADGAEQGSKFAVLSPNVSPALVAILGSLRSGGAWCNVNLRATPEVNADILRRGRCETLFFHSSVAELVPMFAESIPELARIICLDCRSGRAPEPGGVVVERIR